jgi:DNA polymerase elongation subunit (family B)
MHNRFKKLGYHKNIMSNHGKVTYKEDEFQGQKTYQVKTNGNAYIDLMKVYKKFTFVPQPEYNLNYIAFAELGENKVDHSEYVRFDDFYSGNYTIPDNPTEIQKNSDIYKAACEGRIQDVKDLSYSEFCYYGLKDTYLLERIIRKHLFHDIMIDISSKMGVLILDSMGTVKPWGSFIANVCYSKNLIMPPKEEHDHPDIVGGYVRVPNVGKHKWVMASDVTSMYPLVGIVSANMSAETYVSKKDIPSEIRDVILKYYPDQNEEARFDIPEEVHEFIGSKLKELNLSLGINGAMFDNSKLGIIPELVLDIYLGRKADKGKKFKFEQKKILLSGILEDRKTV